METLFEFDGQNITINPILLSIKEFEKIWKRDKTKDKRKARKELIYIYGMVSNNEDNIWKDYTDIKEREKIIISDLFEDEDWVPDMIVEEALRKYKQRYPKTETDRLLETLMMSMIKIKNHIDNIDLNERDNQGRLVHNPKTIMDIATQAVKKYMEIEELIEKIKNRKKLSVDKIRGGGEEGIFEDENTLKDLFD